MSGFKGCDGAKFSNRIEGQQISRNQGNPFTPEAASFVLYNNTNVIVTFEGVPLQAGGFICYDEMNEGCYDQPMQIQFPDGAYTGSVVCHAIRKYNKVQK